MKRYLMLIALVAIVAAGSFALTRSLMPRAGEEDQMAWLVREFKLTPTQAAAVAKLQADYQPVCAGHCQLIMAASERLAGAPNDPAVQAEVAQLVQKCRDATQHHLRDVAARMAPEQGRRFLALVEPNLSRHAHQGPFGLK